MGMRMGGVALVVRGDRVMLDPLLLLGASRVTAGSRAASDGLPIRGVVGACWALGLHLSISPYVLPEGRDFVPSDGFDEVVLCPGLECLHHILLAVVAAHDDNRHVLYCLDEVETTHFGHSQVCEDQVGQPPLFPSGLFQHFKGYSAIDCCSYMIVPEIERCHQDHSVASYN